MTEATILDNVQSEPAVQTTEQTQAAVVEKPFRESLPETFRTDPVFKNFQSMEDLARSYKSAASMVGMDKNLVVKKPREGASPEDLNDYYKAIGRPDKADAYVAPQDVKVDPAALTGLQNALHASGASQDVYSAVVKYMSKTALEESAKAKAENEQAIEQTIQTLKQEFGEAYQQKLILAKEAITQVGGDELMEALKQSGAINNPVVVKALAKWGEPFKDSANFVGTPNKGGALTPDEAKIALSEIKLMPAYQDYLGGKAMPELTDKIQRLNKYIYNTVA
jgi:hypothetical protein